MRRINKNSKIKEPVRLRAKKLADGNRSLYLDTYVSGKRTYEFLRIYLIPEKTQADKETNEASLRAANAIKAERTLVLINGKAGINSRRCDYSLEGWIEHIVKEKEGIRAASSIRPFKRLVRHIGNYRKLTRLEDIDREFCIGFADYLRKAKALNSPKTLMQGTQFELLNTLSIVLNEAVRDGLITTNPMRQLRGSERIKKPESVRDHLTPEEVGALVKISGTHIKAGDDIGAFIFCCFCGLRHSDIVRLKWENIVETPTGKEINVTMKKTHRPVRIPLSEQACSLLPPKGSPEELVFVFPSYGITLRRLKKTVSEAGIKKKVTFHVSRHTFATMMLTAGADLYTVSKLVGHTDIRTTQIYAKVVDRRKRESVALLDRLF